MPVHHDQSPLPLRDEASVITIAMLQSLAYQFSSLWLIFLGWNISCLVFVRTCISVNCGEILPVDTYIWPQHANAPVVPLMSA